MIRQAARSCIVLVLALGAAAAAADSPPPIPYEPSDTAGETPDAALETYHREQRDLFDALRGDASPRVQVLAGRIYLDESDLSGALRPKPEDVATRAARLAPDDAFVQWAAANQGSFASSQCGPTRRPEAEVANLVRLEPDNAGALQFAAALAHAKGDQAALDDALSRMAAARRADDHLGEEITLWRKVYATRPMEDWQKDPGMTPQAAALYRALMQTYGSSSAAWGLKKACTPDAQSERTWQRLGWCADAGRLLAGKGNSFVLRELGLDLLETSGAKSDEIAELRRQFDWLQTHEASPMDAFGDSAKDLAADLAADWQGAPNEIAAAERRLDRTGQPRTAPAGWIKPAAESHKEDTEQKAAWESYVRALIEDMRGSSDVRAQALALTSGDQIVKMFDLWSANEKKAAAAEAKTDPVADLAAANADDLILQWIAATSPDQGTADAKARAVANVQRLDADNAAAWTISLPSAGTNAQPILQRMAAASRYDEHVGEMLGLWLAAIQKRPIPAAALASLPMSEVTSAEAAGKSTALMMAMMNSISASPYGSLAKACRGPELNDAQRKDTCVAIGRLMLNSGRSLISTGIGESLLRNADALGTDEQARARQLAWWYSVQSETFRQNDAAIEAYFADYLSTGNEIEAMRLNATRSGKAEPPANWVSPNEKRAVKR